MARAGNSCFMITLIGVFLMILFCGCAVMGPKWKRVGLTDRELEIAEALKIDQEQLKRMKAKPLYKFTEKELDRYLGYLQDIEPDLRRRVQHLARKTVGQPYQIFLLGEFPFEVYDTDPLYSLRKSDCVVFSEHMYAMALAHDWSSFFAMLQRIRYKDGQIGMLTRNHYTVADWDRNNSWLVEDITEELAGDKAVKDTMQVDKARFFSRYGIGQDIPVDTVEWSYIPYELLPEIVHELQPGDFVNIVRGNDDGKYVGHVGLITRDGDTVYFLHSARPKVKEKRIMGLYEDAEEYNDKRRKENEKIVKKNEKIERHNARVRARGKGKEKPLVSMKPYFYGFKFLRLRDDSIAELVKIDGADAPRLTFPAGKQGRVE